MWNRRNRLGIAVSCAEIGVSLQSGWGKEIQSEQASHNMRMRDGDLNGLAAALGPLLDKFPAQVRRADTIVQVALPDPIFQQAALRFDEFPTSAQEARSLVHWRLKSQLQLKNNNSAAGYLVTSQGRDTQTGVLAQMAPQSVVDAVAAQLWQVGLVPSAIDGMSRYLCRPQPARAGAVYWHGAGWWCLRPFDSTGAPQPHFAAWLDAENHPPSEQVMRRVQRVLGSVDGAGYLDTISYGVASDALKPVAKLAQELSIDQTAQKLGNWKTAAARVADKTNTGMSVIPAPRNYAALAALAIYLGCVILIGALWLKTSDFWQIRAKTLQIDADNARISAQLEQESTALAQSPTRDEIENLRQRVDWYNNQISNGAHPLIDHLDLLEKALPDNVRLNALFYDRPGRYLTLSLMSGEEDALRSAYAGLSQSYSQDFSASVDLERQVTLDSSGARIYQYDVRISE